jgi:hypothetical protein
MIYLSDVDVVLKLARCGFLGCLPELLGVAAGEIKIQHLASLKGRVSKLTKESQRKELAAFCAAHSVIAGAADVARQEALLLGGMDSGEALLFAEAEATGGIVVTGDKRAIRKYVELSTPAQRAKVKVICWEQLLLRVFQLRGYEDLRQGCCEALESDGVLRLAFTNGLATPKEHALKCIQSYLRGAVACWPDLFYTFNPLTHEPTQRNLP